MKALFMRRLLALSTLLAGVPFLSPAHAEAPFSFSQTPGQLPKNIVPTSYVINVQTDLKKLSLIGTESISLDVLSAGSDITLNQAGLTLSSAIIDGSIHASITHHNSDETVTLHTETPLSTGHHTLAIHYTGPILETPNGVYINDYTTQAGAPRRMLVTQFEVADARRLFPGWDEPAFKATYQLNVTLPKDYVAVSNMPIQASHSLGRTEKYVSFATTPRMSSYLLALVAGDMKSLHGRVNQTDIGVYAPSGLEKNGAVALDAAEHILPYYNDYFDVPYPLPKMDMLAIPGNYQAGAMENWGALTYIDDALLFNDKTSTPDTREIVYEVVAHEMAHQWSGDLVTMGWWNNLWLNEGFATWMELKSTDKMNPEWNIWTRQHSSREATLATDSLPTTHPIQQVIHNVSEASSVFDSISYGKGSLVIRMIENWLGEDTFRDGMRLYMKTHAYNNATSQDLWNALASVSHQNVATVARSFTEQPGVPLISVSSTCDKGHSRYTLSQSRFTIHDPHAAPLTWSIPVVAGGPGLTETRFILGSTPLTLDLPTCHSPLKLNLGESGYYRVQYDQTSLAAIMPSLAYFSASDRVNLLGDSYALFKAHKASLSQTLSLIDQLISAHEKDDAVLSQIVSILKEINNDEQGSSDLTHFQAYARHILQPTLERLGWSIQPNETAIDTMLRPVIINALGEMEDPTVLEEAQKDFAHWEKDPASLSPTLIQSVTPLAMKHATNAEWESIANKIRTAHDTETKLSLFYALAHASSPDLIRKNVSLAYSGAIANGRVDRVLAMIASYSQNPDLVWSIVKEHEADIRTHLSPESQDSLLPSIARFSHSDATLTALQNDPSSHSTNAAAIITARAITQIRTHQETRTTIQENIHEWQQHH